MYFQDEEIQHAKDFIYKEGVDDKEEVDKDNLWKNHLEKMKNPKEWADNVELKFMHRMLKRTIVVVMSSGEDDRELTIEGHDQGDRRQQILLGHRHENHYVSLEPADEHSKSEYY